MDLSRLWSAVAGPGDAPEGLAPVAGGAGAGVLDLFDLPAPVLEQVLADFDVADAVALAGTCTTLRALVLRNADAVARAFDLRWGASLEAARDSAAHVAGLELVAAAAELDRRCTKLLARGHVDMAARELGAAALAGDSLADVAAALLRRGVEMGGQSGRRVAAWVCKQADAEAEREGRLYDQPRIRKSESLLNLVVRRLPGFQGQDVLEALRSLIKGFPFLPMDAGRGANRVIAAFAYEYAAQLADDPADEAAVCDVARKIHVLTYALIMLNTDLHNEAIRKKITFEEWARSVENTEAAGYLSGPTLEGFYRSLRFDSPLRLAPSSLPPHQQASSTLTVWGARFVGALIAVAAAR